MNFTTLAHIRDVIAASDPRHDNKRPKVDLHLLRHSAYELIALHLEGKAPRDGAHQEILDKVAAMLRKPGFKARTVEDRIARLICLEIQQAILRIEQEIAKI